MRGALLHVCPDRSSTAILWYDILSLSANATDVLRTMLYQYCFTATYAMLAHQLKSSLATRPLAAAGQGLCSGIGFPGLTALTANSPHVDVCVVCSEEGDLLCCDFCPATHHLTCLEPPMTSLPSVSKPRLGCLLSSRDVYHCFVVLALLAAVVRMSLPNILRFRMHPIGGSFRKVRHPPSFPRLRF